MLEAFPMELRHDVASVMDFISKRTHGNTKIGETEYGCTYTLLDGQNISFPYRIYYLDKNDIQSFLYSHDRMISYWNEFYRNQCFHYRNHIGEKLFSECFGYTRSMEKERKQKKSNK